MQMAKAIAYVALVVSLIGGFMAGAKWAVLEGDPHRRVPLRFG
jgi:hypothetical protein